MKFSKNPIEQKSFEFALEIIKAYKEMIRDKECVLSKQLLRSATSIGSNIQEAQAAYSRKEFASKMSISSKEARETRYWLMLSKHGELTKAKVDHLIEANDELIRMLTAIVKSAQAN